jgi:quinol-cytochrome oxidoreductase complex cytochrome b subunit
VARIWEQGPWQPTGPPNHSSPGTAGQHNRVRATYTLFGIGGGLLALSPLLPWINVILVGSINLFRLTSIANSVVVLPWAMVAVGATLVVMSLTKSRLRSLAVVAIITIIAALLAGGGDLASLVRAVDASDGLASFNVGFYAALAALAVLAIGAFRVLHVRATPPPRPTEPVPLDPRPGWKPDPWAPGRSRYWDGYSWWPESR